MRLKTMSHGHIGCELLSTPVWGKMAKAGMLFATLPVQSSRKIDEEVAMAASSSSEVGAQVMGAATPPLEPAPNSPSRWAWVPGAGRRRMSSPFRMRRNSTPSRAHKSRMMGSNRR